MIRTVFFDLDDTLLDFHAAERAALTATLRELGIDPAPAVLSRYSEINRSFWQLLERGGITRAELKVQRYAQLFEELGQSASPQEAAHRYEGHLSEGHWFIPGAQELLLRLYGRMDLYLVTNGSLAVQRGRLKSAGIGKYFRGIFISEELGCNKPSREYFERCFAQIPDFSPEDSILVGDSLTSDIQGGKNAGLRTVWFNPAGLPNPSGPQPDYEVHTLKEAGDLLLGL